MVMHIMKNSLIAFSFWLCLTIRTVQTVGNYYLPTVFWNPDSPALNARYWSKTVNVKSFQTITFLCPSNYINIARYKSIYETGSYYNLYVREVPQGDTNLDYNTVCDPKESKFVFACNVSRTEVDLSTKMMKTFKINKDQARPDEDPALKIGKDYIFFSTSDGNQNSLVTASKKCTMVFRIHHCNETEHCPISNCSTYGREEVCSPKLTTQESSTSVPRNLHVIQNKTTSSSLTISWREPLTILSNISYYSVCFRANFSNHCQTQIAEANKRTATLEKLNASTVYRMRVRAYTCNGVTEYSNEIFARTKKEDVIFPLAKPTEVTAVVGSDLSLTITWKIPQSIKDDIIYYSVCLRVQGSECITQLVEPTKTSTTIYELKESTNYFIRVRAHSLVGPGNYSDEIEKEMNSPVTGETKGEKCPRIEAVSLIIGLVIGIATMAAISVVAWWITKRKRGSKERHVKNISNDAYRQSMVSDTFNLTTANIKPSNTANAITTNNN